MYPAVKIIQQCHNLDNPSCLFTYSFSVLLISVMKWQALECFFFSFFFFFFWAGNEIFSIFLQPGWWHGLCYCCSDTDIPGQHTYMIKMPVQQTDDKWLVTSPLPSYQPHTQTRVTNMDTLSVVLWLVKVNFLVITSKLLCICQIILP